MIGLVLGKWPKGLLGKVLFHLNIVLQEGGLLSLIPSLLAAEKAIAGACAALAILWQWGDKPKNEKPTCEGWPSRRTERRTCIVDEIIEMPSLAHLPFRLLPCEIIMFLNWDILLHLLRFLCVFSLLDGNERKQKLFFPVLRITKLTFKNEIIILLKLEIALFNMF